MYGNVTDAVTERLRRMILEGELAPSQWLRQDELASQLGVSTMPIREALRRLQAEGLVVFVPRRGARVAELSLAEFDELDRISEELELLGCRWLAEDFSRLPLPRLRQLLAELEEAEGHHDVPRRLELVRAFRTAIHRACGKPYLERLHASMLDVTAQYRRLFSSIDELAPRRLASYRAIYQACEQHDREGLLTAMRQLYALARQAIFSRLGQSQPDGGGEAPRPTPPPLARQE